MNHNKLQLFHQKLYLWYAKHGRKSLPWRNTADPYAIWISEVMLQQTQVATVLERYYSPFLKAFPTVEALAKADLQQVLKCWEGLGYYRRARNLHAAACLVAGDRCSVFSRPNTEHRTLITDLLALPGVGRNTAHAVAAFAFHHPVPVMEANVKRVLCRIFALSHPTDKLLWERAEALLDTQNPFDYNQAMMDLGAMACTKRTPKCRECPAASICKGKAMPEAYPAPVKKKQPPTRRATITAYYNNLGRYLVQKREGEFLHGLWGFVEVPCHSERSEESQANKRSFAYTQDDNIGTIRQVYSHFTLEADVYRIPGKGQKGVWKTLEEIAALPLSKADIKVVALLQESVISGQ